MLGKFDIHIKKNETRSLSYSMYKKKKKKLKNKKQKQTKKQLKGPALW